MEDNKEGIVTSESAGEPKIIQIEMDEQRIIEKKLELENAKIHKDKTDSSLAELERQRDENIPRLFLLDDIRKLEDQINRKVVITKEGKEEPMTEADLVYAKIRLDFLNKSKELDLPMRELLFQINQLRYQKNRIDTPEQQIDKLEKEIRERKENTLASRVKRPPVGVY